MPPGFTLFTAAAIQSQRLPWLLLAMVALGAVLLLALRPFRKAPAAPVDSPSAARPDEASASFKLALWASGEQFWEYDLLHRRLRRVDAHNAEGALVTHSREGELPPIHDQDLPQVMERLRGHLQGDSAMFVSEHRMQLEPGQWTWVRAAGCVVERDGEGRPLRLAGTARDITALRTAEYEHRIASEVMRSMSEAVAVMDGRYGFVTINQAFTRITGYTEAEVVGQPVRMMASGQNPQDMGEHVRQQLQREGRWSGEAWNTRKNGEDMLCRVEINAVLDASGQQQLYVLVLNDITEQKRAEQELRYLVNYDTLTSLPNRSLLSERLARAVVRARRENGRVAVLFIDLDRFKDINDSLGHATGDRILRAVASRVQQTVGAQHTVARLSGDEFTVVLEDIGSLRDAEDVAQRIITAFTKPLAFGDRLELAVSPSIGISLYPEHAQVPSDLLKHADTAMYQAKSAGRHTYQVYSEHMDDKTRHRAILASALRRALERGEMSLVYQPRLCLRRQQIVGAEALLRWESRELGRVPPSQFIPLAEETGVILELGAWALRQACQTLHGWHAEGHVIGMSVNVSALQLQRGDLRDVVAATLQDTGIQPRFLELELTESTIMANPAQNADALRACRELGVAIAIDDFGTGYSSLAYLKRLPLTTLKVDQEFVSDLTVDSDDEAITQTIINMGHSLGLTVVAEGVENAGQLGFLEAHGCDEVQGHYVSRALPAAECMDFIREHYPSSGRPQAVAAGPLP